jgi:hypothetical protein
MNNPAFYFAAATSKSDVARRGPVLRLPAVGFMNYFVSGNRKERPGTPRTEPLSTQPKPQSLLTQREFVTTTKFMQHNKTQNRRIFSACSRNWL